MSKFPGAKKIRFEGPIVLEYGAVLPRLEISYETVGLLSPTKDNVVLVCPAFSAHSHICSHEKDLSKGWWESMVGPGKAIDTERFFVVCASLLGGCHGTTGPSSKNPETGRAFASKFPMFTVRDIVNTHMRLLEHLEIEKVYAIVGGSLGGMQVIDAVVRFPERFECFVSISATAYTRPYTAAVRHIGRRAIMADPDFQGGEYGDKWPTGGLRLARELGTLFYRSREEFNERFDWRPVRPPTLEEPVFDVQSYLNHQGAKVVGNFDPNTYVKMSMAMDLHDVTRGFEFPSQAYSRIQARGLVVGVVEDRLIPMDEQRSLYRSLIDVGCRCGWKVISSPIGHDAFLVEHAALTPIFQEFFK